jgi:integrase
VALVLLHEKGPRNGISASPSFPQLRARAALDDVRRRDEDAVGERGRKRDFHSFRHTFGRLALEGGGQITWVSQQLGHSNITSTVNTYGHWARAAEKLQAERLAGAFTL